MNQKVGVDGRHATAIAFEPSYVVNELGIDRLETAADRGSAAALAGDVSDESHVIECQILETEDSAAGASVVRLCLPASERQSEE
ncbi:MAG: hypothetical protein AB7U97_26010 [Pirellulales bacterium]